MIWLALSASVLSSLPVRAQSSQPPATEDASGSVRAGESAGDSQSPQQSSGSISGRVVDPDGQPVAGVHVKLSRQDLSLPAEVLSDEDGQFYFVNIAPGPFHLTFTADGFATQASVGTVRSGEALTIPTATLALATERTEIRVGLPAVEVAQEQLHEEEQQRVLGVLPNFYVTYVAHAAPLSPRQKFQLAWKSMIDPVTFGVTGAVAGIQQASNQFSGYGQGGDGFAKRYGAAYADDAIGTFIGGAILPSLLKQDPRYFYKGTGSKKSRVLYAIATSVICKGDNGHWQPNYSGIAGNLAAGGISNLYYPSTDRNGALVFENAAINIGAAAGTNLLQEFVIRKLTSNSSNRNSNPANP